VACATCTASPGSFCGIGATLATGEYCPQGQFSTDGAVSACSPCDAVAKGYACLQGTHEVLCCGYCCCCCWWWYWWRRTISRSRACGLLGVGSSTAAGTPCPRGRFSTGGRNASCVVCAPGYICDAASSDPAPAEGALAVAVSRRSIRTPSFMLEPLLLWVAMCPCRRSL
jgi:hypothetical protein